MDQIENVIRELPRISSTSGALLGAITGFNYSLSECVNSCKCISYYLIGSILGGLTGAIVAYLIIAGAALYCILFSLKHCTAQR